MKARRWYLAAAAFLVLCAADGLASKSTAIHTSGKVPGSQAKAASASVFIEPRVQMDFIAVPAGCFIMGDQFGDGQKDEKPVHEVCLDGFSMGKYAVTVGQFREFVKATGYLTSAERGGGCFTTDRDGQWAWRFLANWRAPGFSQADNHPAVCISWQDAVEFGKWLTSQGGGRIYRLPTEAEWEYAARAGTAGRNFWGNRVEDACKYANVRDLTSDRTFPGWEGHNCDDGNLFTAPVGSYLPNGFGLYDMMGNVWQWTSDWYDKSYYRRSPRNNPEGPPSGSRRVPRGGSWRSNPEHVRVSLRIHPPPRQTAGVGFRLVSIFEVGPPPAPLAKTGQGSCFEESRLGVIDCAGTGQDGDILSGNPWPVPRYLDNGDRTIIDRLSGQTWSKDASPAGEFKSWQEALDFIRILNEISYLGYSDWRLPNLNELESLSHQEGNLVAWLETQGFLHPRAGYYWTSSTYTGHASHAWAVNMLSGTVAGRNKADSAFVWPIRIDNINRSALAKTGQTACYDSAGQSVACAGTGQDGESQTGVGWPSPRFMDNGDQTVTDRLTGLIWSQDGKAPGPDGCAPGTRKTQQAALEFVNCLNLRNYLDKSDWRLPNRNELVSLVNRGEPNSSTFLISQGFTNVEAQGYWSSTSYAPVSTNAWSVNLHDGAVVPITKKIQGNVWPVRGGPDSPDLEEGLP